MYRFSAIFVHYKVCLMQISNLSFCGRDFLGQQSHHPVKTVQEQLLRELKSIWPVCTMNEDFPELVSCLPETPEACDSTLTHSEVYWIKPTDTYIFDQRENESMGDKQSFTGSYALRPSLLLHVQEITQNEDFSPGTLHAVSGLVFQRAPISSSRSPAFHQLLLVGMFPAESHPVQCFQDCLESLLASYGVSFEEAQTGLDQQVWMNSKTLSKFGRIAYLPCFSSALDEGLQLIAVSINLDHLATLTFGISDWRFPAESHPVQCFQDCLESLLASYGVSFEEAQTGLDQQVWMNSKTLSKFGRIAYLPCFSSALDEGLQLIAVSINLDHLATLTFGISDWRFPAESHPVQCFQDCLESLLASYGVSFEEAQTGLDQQVWMNSKTLSKFGRIAYLPCFSSALDEGLQLIAVSINLDHLATLTFGISDWRLLWSADPRFLKHFELHPLGPFSPFSLYPPSYSHDISFWMEPERYDELDFHALVREASCGAVKNMALVDRFRHPHMGHASLCYRLTYQSPDRALSHSQALGLQNQLRRLLPLRLQVTLR